MGSFREFPAIAVTTTGSAGSATGSANGTEFLNGMLRAVTITYHASAPSSTVVAIKEIDGAARTLLTITGNTSGTFYPRVQMQGSTGSALSGVYEPYELAGRRFRVEVTVSDALTNAVSVVCLVAEF